MAGGKGTRLAELTKNEIPKPMVKLLDRPLLEWQVECLRRNGVDDIVLVIGYLGEVIRDYFGDGRKWGVRIRYFAEEKPLGTAGALPEMRGLLENEFVLLFGDLLLDVDLKRMLDFHQKHNALATLFVHPNAHPFDSDLIHADGEGKVQNFDSKHNDRSGYWYDNCVNAGLYVIDKSVLEYIPDKDKVDLEKDLLSPLCEQNKAIYAYASPEYVKDVGTVERIRTAERELENGYVSARNLTKKQKAVFLDRDGTLTVWKGLVYKPEQLELEPGAAEAVREINRSGYLAVLVTNQPVVARGLCGVEDVELIHRKLQTLLGQDGAYLDAIRFCPHHPDRGYSEENPDYKIPCHCRKPDIGMLEDCAEKFNIDLSASWMVGDTTIDIQTGINANCKTALVLTGEAGQDGKYTVQANLTAENVREAVRRILTDDEDLV